MAYEGPRSYRAVIIGRRGAVAHSRVLGHGRKYGDPQAIGAAAPVLPNRESSA